MTGQENALVTWIDDFLADLENANRSPHTRRAYASDLHPLAAFHIGPAQAITTDTLRRFLKTHARPQTSCPKQLLYLGLPP